MKSLDLPDVTDDTDALSDLDWAPPCEHGQHDAKGSTEPAAWVVKRTTEPCPVCGRVLPPLFLWCTPCLQRIMRATRLRCIKCSTYNKGHRIKSVEPL